MLKTFGEIKIEKLRRDSNLWLTDPYMTILQIVLCCYVGILERKKCKIMIDSFLIESTSQYGDSLYNFKHVNLMIMFSRGTVVRCIAKLIIDKNISSQKVFIKKYVMSNVFILVISGFLKDT